MFEKWRFQWLIILDDEVMKTIFILIMPDSSHHLFMKPQNTSK